MNNYLVIYHSIKKIECITILWWVLVVLFVHLTSRLISIFSCRHYYAFTHLDVWLLAAQDYFQKTKLVQWYATHDKEGHEQDLEVQILNKEVYPIVQLVVFVTQPHVGLRYLITQQVELPTIELIVVKIVSTTSKTHYNNPWILHWKPI